ncbi:DNA protecting protein DprA [Vibrio azureus]|uniref:Smf protein n=1 Tax=Vibrio azureus NBRC 104587 TaxID=1219077 RepID=U3C3G4_9VIBR|nr:DNA-processing protein DprA [Vibrio azureus]AUI84964.1 DNA protecting protein DprA [Vibrio azureus]GAD75984.1 Smf protein [Vibrio azureus NBRC 104587]
MSLENERELAAWLKLSCLPGIGGVTLSKLLSKDTPVNIVQYSQEQLRHLGLSSKQLQAWPTVDKEVEACLDWCFSSELHHIVTLSDPFYPPLLKQTVAPPPLLFVKGEVASLSLPQIAMVGSRNASVDGVQHARYFAADFAQQALVVTSGLALGIDGHAHDGALQAGGKTIAVLGSGLEHIYPARHRGLAERITASGALVSEFRPSAKPRAEHFPRRNRIISGLSLGVLVVEAAEKSGSLITARYALEQSREVFALPASINAPNASGGNQLIRNGACLVQNTQHVLSELQSLLNWSVNQSQDLFSASIDQEELPFPELLANVGNEATPVDILSSRTNIPVQEVMMQLLELELSGHVVAVSGGYIRKRRG